MYIKTVKYENFLGEEVTEDLYFNYSKAEIFQMEAEENFTTRLENISKSKDLASLSKEFRALILGAYGELSPDGKRFAKSEEKSIAFSQTGAYDELLYELVTDTKKAIEFVTSIFPKEVQEKAKSSEEYKAAVSGLN